MRRPTTRGGLPLLAAALLLSATLPSTGCSIGKGRAAGLRFAIERAAEQLLAAGTDDEALVSFTSRHDPSGRFSIALFPPTEVSLGELIAAGMPGDQAERIFRELGYIDIGRGHKLVVLFPNKRITFTGVSSRLAFVEELLVVSDVERCTIVLNSDARGVRISEIRSF